MFNDLIDPSLKKKVNENSVAAKIIDTAINMGLEVIGGREEEIKNIENKLVEEEL